MVSRHRGLQGLSRSTRASSQSELNGRDRRTRLVGDLRAFHAEPDRIEADEIAAHQQHVLEQHYAARAALRRQTEAQDLKEMFMRIRDHNMVGEKDHC